VFSESVKSAMSKISKPSDRRSQVVTAAADRPDDWCKGCREYRVVHGEHSANWTAKCQVCGNHAGCQRPSGRR
jgi:hypothetical protein